MIWSLSRDDGVGREYILDTVSLTEERGPKPQDGGGVLQPL